MKIEQINYRDGSIPQYDIAFGQIWGIKSNHHKINFTKDNEIKLSININKSQHIEKYNVYLTEKELLKIIDFYFNHISK